MRIEVDKFERYSFKLRFCAFSATGRNVGCASIGTIPEKGMVIIMGNGFFERAYEIARQIPAGRVTSYGRIAARMGSPHSSRTVGYAMRAAPEDVPAHRIVHKSGGLCPNEAFGAMQKELLEKEGVGFLEDGRVDMQRFMWMDI